MNSLVALPRAALVAAVIISAACVSGVAWAADDAIDALADVAVKVNDTVENIGARRLQTVMERVLDEISFTASDKTGETITIDAAYVQCHVGDLANDADLSKFIL